MIEKSLLGNLMTAPDLAALQQTIHMGKEGR